MFIFYWTKAIPCFRDLRSESQHVNFLELISKTHDNLFQLSLINLRIIFLIWIRKYANAFVKMITNNAAESGNKEKKVIFLDSYIIRPME